MIRLRKFDRSFSRWPSLFRLLGVIAIFLFSFGMLIHFSEPKTFPTLYEGIWWAIVTMATVGYGDYAPNSDFGRAIGILLILSGAGLVSSYFASVSAIAATSEQTYRQGKKKFNGVGHVIIVGWNERSRGIIEELHERNQRLQIVLIDESLIEHPLPLTNIHFIHGKATTDTVLLRANIGHADRVLITADLRQNEFQTDMFSILTLLAIKGLKKDLFCLVEILTVDQRENAWRAGADGLIETNRFASDYMLKKIMGEMDVAELLDDSNVSLGSLALKNEWEQLTYKELTILLLEQHTVVVGIIRKEKKLLPPPLETKVSSDDILLVIR